VGSSVTAGILATPTFPAMLVVPWAATGTGFAVVLVTTTEERFPGAAFAMPSTDWRSGANVSARSSNAALPADRERLRNRLIMTPSQLNLYDAGPSSEASTQTDEQELNPS